MRHPLSTRVKILLTTLLVVCLSGLASADAQQGSPQRESINAKSSPAFSASEMGSFSQPDLSAPMVAPSNDNFASAQAMTLPSTTTIGSVEESTFEIGEPVPSCVSSSLHSIWFSFTSAQPQTLTIKLAGSTFDTVLSIYTGSTINTLTEVACNDDFNTYTDGTSALFNFQTTADTTYYIRVSEWQGEPIGTNAGVTLALKTTPDAINATVNTTNDTLDNLPGDGTCADGGGMCSLRAAVMEANELKPGSVITLPAGTYSFGAGDSGEDAAITGDLDILTSITINGAWATNTIIDAADQDSVFHVRPGGALSLSNLNVTNGARIGDGGGIRVVGPNASLSLLSVTVSDNQAIFGGGIELVGATLIAHNTAIVNNQTADMNGSGMGDGGGISTTMFGNASSLSLTNVTISTNAALNGGGLNLEGNGNLIANNVTVAMNTATFAGGGVRLDGGTASLSNSLLVSNNAASAKDCEGTFTSTGDNFVSVIGGCTLSPDDIVNSTPRIDPLAINYPGKTPSHALRVTSLAMNAGTPETCTASDQRSIIRPQDTACDIGAYERVVVPPGSFTLNTPAQGALITDPPSFTAFLWSDSTLAFSYALQVTRTSDAPDTVVVNTVIEPDTICAAGTCAYLLGAELTDGVYDWTVTANNTGGSTISTPGLVTFTIDGPAPNVIELIDNGGFETKSTTNTQLPLRWKSIKRSDDKRVCNTQKTTFTPFGKCAYRFLASASENSKLVQNVKLDGHVLTTDTVLNFAFRAKSSGTPRMTAKLRVTYLDTELPISPLNLKVTKSNGYKAYSGQLILAGEPKIIKLTLHNQTKTGRVLIDEVTLTYVEAEAMASGLISVPALSDVRSSN